MSCSSLLNRHGRAVTFARRVRQHQSLLGSWNRAGRAVAVAGELRQQPNRSSSTSSNYAGTQQSSRSFFSLSKVLPNSFEPLLKKNDYSTPKMEMTKNNVNGIDARDNKSSASTTLRDFGIANDKIRVNGEASSILLNGVKKKKRRLYSERHFLALRPPNSTSVRVKAVHVAQTLDVVKVLSQVFPHSSTRHLFGKTGVFVQLPPTAKDDLPRFVAVFRYGSVVLFNFTPRQAGRLLENIKAQVAKKPVACGFERKEHYEVVIYPHDQPSVNGDYCLVERLDINAVAVISTIMGQTVALDSYSDAVDELLANFVNINNTVTHTGNFTEMSKSELFRVVSQNNSVFIDMVAKLGIKDRSDMAWNLSQYEQVHQGLKDEFEIEDRFQNIEFKLNLIQQNAKFFLEIMHNQKSNSLEWIIIALISLECGLMVLEMSGLGPAVFGMV